METEPLIIDAYVRSGKVRLVYRHLVQLGDGSQATGEGSECAADQGKFWEMRDALYRRQGEVYSDPQVAMSSFAAELELNEADFTSCLSSGKQRQFVLDDYAAAQNEGVRSRPEFRLNDERLVGALPFRDFQQRIDALAK
ncbi:MAG: thioredoxin domain-containing protein [Chloroflexales bacterium]|nr:thioredoxin domain-containing protein [Chloroflexales bacterium]